MTPGVHAHTHHYIATGQDDSKFGFNLANGDAARAVERAQRSASVQLVGLHCHIGSNVFAADSFDAMTSESAYRRKLSAGEALAEIEARSGTQFDPEVVAALAAVLTPLAAAS